MEYLILDHWSNKVWITREDWEACQKFEKDQELKFAKFMYINKEDYGKETNKGDSKA